MKGVVFTMFLEMVSDRFSEDMVDDIIEDANPPNAGAYTAVGTYPHGEIVALLTSLSRRSGMPAGDLLRAFGSHLFSRFAVAYPQLFKGNDSALEFIQNVEHVIHPEVLKLYPDAELPRFEVEQRDERRLVIRYFSLRHLEDLCEGLIGGCIAHFGGGVSLSRETVKEGDVVSERFTLTQGSPVS
ncbi:MAG: hypothetical protein RLZZ200_1836 [Pseudomonadota bacterium]|jgi:hypothetical protein